jgi:hypothetical protein
MSDKLPFGGSSNTTPNRPKRLLYQQPSWTLPAYEGDITDLEYDLRVGKITEEEFMEAKKKEVATIDPSKRKAVEKSPRHR